MIGRALCAIGWHRWKPVCRYGDRIYEFAGVVLKNIHKRDWHDTGFRACRCCGVRKIAFIAAGAIHSVDYRRTVITPVRMMRTR